MTNRLNLISKLERVNNKNQVYGVFQCDCGKTIEALIYNVDTNHTKSCGCLKSEIVIERNHKHGMYGTKVYRAWAAIKARCLNPKSTAYEYYGAKGISVCDRWLEFEPFLEDMGEPPTDKHSIDRIDVYGNYEPSNCKWSTATEQCRNRTNNRTFTIDGETKCLAEWCEIYKVDGKLVRTRYYNYNWPIERALSEPVNKLKRST